MHRLLALAAVLALAVTSCTSGPSPAALERAEAPATTTTTEPPPEGITLVAIRNASFRPSNLTIDLDEFQIVRWENEDTDREYMITSRERDDNGDRVFEGPLLGPGDSWELDFSQLEVAVHRYFTTLGAQTIPGLVDTRPAQ